MSTPVLGSYSFTNTPDVNGNLLLVSNSAVTLNSVTSTSISATTGTFTTLSGALNGTIGATTPATGVFTTIGAGTAAIVTNYLTLAAGSTTIAPMQFTSGPLQTTVTAGDLEFDGTVFYKAVDTTNGRSTIDGFNYFRLAASGTGITTIADFFGANSAIPLVAGGVYEVEFVCYHSNSASGSVTWNITSTNALQSLTGEYTASSTAGIGAVGTAQTAGINVTASTTTNFPATGTDAIATHRAHIRVVIQANATTGGSTRLRLTAAAGTATPLANSYYKVRRLPAGNAGTFVA